MTAAPYPPFPPYPPYAPYPASAPYPPYPAYPPVVAPERDCGCQHGPAEPATAVVPPPGSAPSPPPVQPGTPPQRRFPGDSRANPLTIYFDFDSDALVDRTVEGIGNDQLARLSQFATDVRNARATATVMDGWASPEGSLPYNTELARRRAQAVERYLRSLMTGVGTTVRTTTELTGPPGSYPQLRRVDVFVN